MRTLARLIGTLALTAVLTLVPATHRSTVAVGPRLRKHLDCGGRRAIAPQLGFQLHGPRR